MLRLQENYDTVCILWHGGRAWNWLRQFDKPHDDDDDDDDKYADDFAASQLWSCVTV